MKKCEFPITILYLQPMYCSYLRYLWGICNLVVQKARFRAVVSHIVRYGLSTTSAPCQPNEFAEARTSQKGDIPWILVWFEGSPFDKQILFIKYKFPNDNFTIYGDWQIRERKMKNYMFRYNRILHYIAVYIVVHLQNKLSLSQNDGHHNAACMYTFLWCHPWYKIIFDHDVSIETN